ncbi:MAG: molecular chaperone DnaJ [Alphaproteobacteria bacterium]|nr:molecular chaperone DnaJ [Alphaproteobacteria bacterium]
MAKKDFYSLLDISRDAEEKEIKAAFRKLAMRYHPDRNQDNPEADQRFKEINEAYEILKDPQKRAAYDQFGHQAFEAGGSGNASGGFSSSMPDFFEDLFGNIMGKGQRQERGGADLRYNIEISLKDAYQGKIEKITVKSGVSCKQCNGSGAAAGSSPKNCSTCSGNGKIYARQGFFRIEQTCVACQGRGQVIEKPCNICSGAGRTSQERTLSVNIPAGVEDGTRIRLSGEGEGGIRGTPSGDLYVFLSIKPHLFFQRDRADLFCHVPISMTKAALGGHIEVPTISGTRTKVKIPEGIQSGKQIRLRGQGMPLMRTKQRGDTYIQVMVETPCNLNKKQKDLLMQFEEASSDSNNPESSGFFAKVKEFWGGISN